ncbi:MAG: hypothetical protein AAF493_03885 [Pseudomonadota bacterium]
MLNAVSKLLGSSEADEFARELVVTLTERYSAEAEQASTRRDDKKLNRALSIIQNQVRDYKKSHRLGVYQKARIGNTFKWELKERGYSEQFVELATKDLIVQLGR